MSLLRLALVATVLAVSVSGCGSGGSKPHHGAKVATTLRATLVARDLPPHWVACVPTRARVHDLTAFRCNVNFGDPHVEAYCAVLDRGRLSYAAWRPPDQGRQDRMAAQAECARRLSAGRGQTSG